MRESDMQGPVEANPENVKYVPRFQKLQLIIRVINKRYLTKPIVHEWRTMCVK